MKYDWLRLAKLLFNLPFPIPDMTQQPQCRLHPPCLKRTVAREMIFLAIQTFFYYSYSIQLTLAEYDYIFQQLLMSQLRPIENGRNILAKKNNPTRLFLCIILKKF